MSNPRATEVLCRNLYEDLKSYCQENDVKFNARRLGDYWNKHLDVRIGESSVTNAFKVIKWVLDMVEWEQGKKGVNNTIPSLFIEVMLIAFGYDSLKDYKENRTEQRWLNEKIQVAGTSLQELDTKEHYWLSYRIRKSGKLGIARWKVRGEEVVRKSNGRRFTGRSIAHKNKIIEISLGSDEGDIRLAYLAKFYSSLKASEVLTTNVSVVQGDKSYSTVEVFVLSKRERYLSKKNNVGKLPNSADSFERKIWEYFRFLKISNTRLSGKSVELKSDLMLPTKVFISSPIGTLEPDQFEGLKQVTLNIRDVLEKDFKINKSNVICESFEIPKHKNKRHHRDSEALFRKSQSHILESHEFILLLPNFPEKISYSGAFFELYFRLGKGLPCVVYAVGEEGSVPPSKLFQGYWKSLEGRNLVKIYYIDNITDVPEHLIENKEDIFDFYF